MPVSVPAAVVLAGMHGHGRWHLRNVERLRGAGVPVRLAGGSHAIPYIRDLIADGAPLTNPSAHGTATALAVTLCAERAAEGRAAVTCSTPVPPEPGRCPREGGRCVVTTEGPYPTHGDRRPRSCLAGYRVTGAERQ
jgi:hypothetical protein